MQEMQIFRLTFLFWCGIISKLSNALVAQLDRVTGYEPVGQGFESLQARQAIATQSGGYFIFKLMLYFIKYVAKEPIFVNALFTI